jgi:hypothetical protein
LENLNFSCTFAELNKDNKICFGGKIMKNSIIGLVFLGIISFGNVTKLMALKEDEVTDITHVFDKKQFEAIVQYVLDKGEIWECYSQFWRSSPFLEMDGFYITLAPKYEIHDDIGEYIKKTHYDVSDFNIMCIGRFMGGAFADILMLGDRVFVTRITNGSLKYRELLDILINDCITKLKDLIRENN